MYMCIVDNAVDCREHCKGSLQLYCGGVVKDAHESHVEFAKATHICFCIVNLENIYTS